MIGIALSRPMTIVEIKRIVLRSACSVEVPLRNTHHAIRDTQYVG